MLSHFSHVWLFAIIWTVACQAPLSMGFCRQECWKWVAMNSSRGSFWSRDRTRVFCTAEPPGKPLLWHMDAQFETTCPSLLCTKSLLLLSHFSRVRLCATPYMAAHQAPPSLGFSRQEHWSGLPFPSPMHESKKWKWSRSVMSNSNKM